MSLSRYLVGIACLGFAIGSCCFAASRWRSRLVPVWRGVTAVIADAVLALASVLLIAEILGSIGALYVYVFVPACVIAGLFAGWLAGPSRVSSCGSEDLSVVDGSRGINAPIVLESVVIGLVTALWVGGAIVALQAGPTDVDSQYYHLPHAARFVQERSLTELHFVIPGDASPYHPMNAEVFHAIGMLILRSDVLSPVLNLGWLALGFAAASVAGRRLGAGSSISVAGVGLFLATPLMVRTQAGSAHNDVAGVALFLVACALLLSGPRTPGSVTIAGIAAGLALGTKLSLVAPILVLTLVLWFSSARAGRRARLIAAWLPSVVVTSVFWFVRNLVHTGNPIPSLRLGVGDVALPRPPMDLIDRFGYSVADYVLDVSVWRQAFIPGVAAAFGVVWPLIVLAAVVGSIVALFRARSLTVRGLGAAVPISAVAYAFTPTTAFGHPGRPLFFAENLRYAAPAIVLGLVLVAAEPSVRRRPWVIPAVAAAASLSVARFASHPGARAAIVAVVAGGLLAALIVASQSRRVRLSPPLVVVVLILAVGTGYLVQSRYHQLRYTERGRYAALSSRDPAPYIWAQSVRRARIGVAGAFVHYPLYGPDLSNRVEYVGELRSDGAFVDHDTCRSWTEALAMGGYDFVVVAAPFPDAPVPPQAEWTRKTPGAREILRGHRTSIFGMDSPPAVSSPC